MKKRGQALLEQIRNSLSNEGFDFEQEPSIGGLQPDFVIHGPNDELVIVEAKAWPSTGGNTARAIQQVERYREATGADQAFLVVDGLKRNFGSKGVFNPDGFVAAIKEYFGPSSISQAHTRGTSKPKRKDKEKKQSERLVFAAMPFSREYDDTFLVAMSHAAEAVEATCKRIDKIEFEGDIVQEIKKLIRQSVAVIIDLSESNPNVLYEAGYAHALKKPVVHISSTPLDDLPFNRPKPA